MQQLLYRLWIALAVSTLTINYSRPVFAKIQPSPKSSPNQVNVKPSTHKQHSVNKAASVDRSKQPWEVTLSSQLSAPKQLHSKKTESPRRQIGNSKLPAKAKANRSIQSSTHNNHIKDNFSSQGIEYLIDIDRYSHQKTDFSAINRLTD
jgi:hypothetical protein